MKRSVCLVSISVLLVAVIAVMSVAFFGMDDSFSFWDAQGSGNTQTSSNQVYAFTSGTDSGTTVPSGSADRGAYNPSLKYFDFILHLGGSETGEIELDNGNRSFSDNGILSFTATFSGTISPDSYVEITGYRGNVTSLYIPSSIKINGTLVPVKKISGITSTTATSAITVIEIPSSITSIERGCFSGFKLTKLAFVGECNQTLNIGARAFARSVTTSTAVTISGVDVNKTQLPTNFICGSNAFAGWN